MAQQSILLTVLPHPVAAVDGTVGVSVLVTPRLTGAPTLGSFPDWLKWTERLSIDGFSLTLSADGNPIDVTIDPGPLRPRLWTSLFTENTRVDDYVFDDYTDHTVLSYPARDAMLIVKTIYQRVARELGLPVPPGGQEDAPSRAAALAGFLDGLQLDEFDDLRRRRLRRVFGQRIGAVRPRRPQGPTAPTGTDGLPSAAAVYGMDDDMRLLKQQVSSEFTLYSRMPAGEPLTKPDMETLLDFHKVISALNSYPELLRALGLVFDLELPAEAVPQTGAGAWARLRIMNAETGWPTEAGVSTIGAIADTAYAHQILDDGRRYFSAANRVQDDRGTAFGLLRLDPDDFCLSQFDVDGAMQKLIMLSSGFSGGSVRLAPSRHPDKFDDAVTVPALRSIGITLIHSGRARALLTGIEAAAAFNARAVGQINDGVPLFAEDLVRGYRVDMWDAFSGTWRSLHRRDAIYDLNGEQFDSSDEEGFIQLAATQPVPSAEVADPRDLYLHEAMARWNGWSLSVPPLGKALSRHADPDRAIPPDDPNDLDPDDRQNEALTPFAMTTSFRVTPRTLPSLRFGRRYRLRARVVDVAGNSLRHDDPLSDDIAREFAIPPGDDTLAYLRFEPVPPPQIVRRDDAAVTGNGSDLNRLVIRTFNDDPARDEEAPDLTGSERHICPPRTSIEIAERHGMLDDASGRLKGDGSTYQMLVERDDEAGSQFPSAIVPGQNAPIPIVVGDRIDALPYLPDPLARSAALRDLPGAPETSRGDVASGALIYGVSAGPSPQPGSVTEIAFGTDSDWRAFKPFRLVLAEGSARPDWDEAARELMVFLPKGTTAVVPLSSGCDDKGAELSAIWQWLREYVADMAGADARPDAGSAGDWLATAASRINDGGFWMWTPPVLLTLVSAVQQPIGHPRFEALSVQRPRPRTKLEQMSIGSRVSYVNDTHFDRTAIQMAAITAWRAPKALDAFLIGGLRVNAQTTAHVDIHADWEEWVDDPATEDPPIRQLRSGFVDTVPLPDPANDYILRAPGQGRAIGIYNQAQDLIGFTAAGDIFGRDAELISETDAAPRHYLGDTKHRRIDYRAVSTSRYREYFPQDQDLDFTRSSERIRVDVPASARPPVLVIHDTLPMFGWERQTASNVARSVRHGGGVRVYLDRPWYASGDDELLGVVLWQGGPASNEVREAWKNVVTQWGRDPIWDTESPSAMPYASVFRTAVAIESDVEFPGAKVFADADGEPARVTVVGHTVAYDPERDLWFSDISIDTASYCPFIRLALARYQPYAIDSAKLSSIVLSDFVQLAPDRSVIVTTDPGRPRETRLSVTGIAPHTLESVSLRVRIQHHFAPELGQLGWRDVDDETAWTERQLASPADPDTQLWCGKIHFAQPPANGQFRLVVEEREHIAADYEPISPVEGDLSSPGELLAGRVTFAEIISLAGTLTVRPAESTASLSSPFPETTTAPGAEAVEPGAGAAEPAPQVLDRIVLQICDGVDIPYLDGAENDLAALVGGAWDVAVQAFPAFAIDRLFTSVVPEELDAMLGGGADELGTPSVPLHRFFALVCPEGIDPATIVAALAQFTQVFDRVYVENRPALPTITFGDDELADNQMYLEPAPMGFDAKYAWTQPGGDGHLVKVADVEHNWDTTHEDFSANTEWLMDKSNIPDWGSLAPTDHGTQVVGVIAMADNTVGGVGIVPGAKVLLASIWRKKDDGTFEQQTADTIRRAAKALNPGDILLIELETDDCMPIEAEPDVFSAIAEATNEGIIVIEPGGNGPGNGSLGRYYDLDTLLVPRLGWRALAGLPMGADSGAIMVACSDAVWQGPIAYSPRGRRIDCYAQGELVFSAKSPPLIGPPPPAPEFEGQPYTIEFAGTSSAAALIAGAAASVQSMAQAVFGRRLIPAEMRSVLSSAALGTPSANPGTDRIGVMPDLKKIANFLTAAAGRTVIAGQWFSVRKEHELVHLGRRLVLDWVPSTREWTVWPYDSLAITGDPLPSPEVRSGTWKTISAGHTLLYLGGDLVLDYVPATGDYRLFSADWTAPDFLPGPPVTKGQWSTIRDRYVAGVRQEHRLTYLGGDHVLDWVPQDRTFRIWRLDRRRTRQDPLLGVLVKQPDDTVDEQPLAEGVLPDAEIGTDTGILAVDTNEVLIWHAATGNYGVWFYDRTFAADPPIIASPRSGNWPTIRTGWPNSRTKHVLVWLGSFGSGQLLDWQPSLDDEPSNYRLYPGVPPDGT